MKPTIIEHPTFGRLLWDERMTSYEGEADLGPDGTIRLSLQPFTDVVPGQEPGELGDPTAFVALCAGKLGWVREHVQMLSSYVASQLLADHNDGDWCAGQPITESEFVRRITLTDVTIDQDGTRARRSVPAGQQWAVLGTSVARLSTSEAGPHHREDG